MKELVLIADAPKSRYYLKYLKILEKSYGINIAAILYTKIEARI